MARFLRGMAAALCALALAGCAPGGGALHSMIATRTACTPALYFRPRWSPDGKRIAYLFAADTNRSGGFTDIDVMNANGSQDRRILSDPTNTMWSLAWFPDGTRLAFDHQSTTIDQISAAGGSPSLFIQGENSFVANPNWSPDGTRFTFASNFTGNWDVYYRDNSGLPALLDMRRWTAQLRRFADLNGDEQAPAFSPDDTQVAFVSARAGGFDLYVRPVEGGPPRQMTSTGADEYYPAWSPDGRTIVYSVGYGSQAHLMTIGADGANPTRLGDGYSPDWSPEPGPDGDGSRIVFVSERTGRAEIDTMRPDGSDVRQLTVNPTPALCLH